MEIGLELGLGTRRADWSHRGSPAAIKPIYPGQSFHVFGQ